MAANPTTGSPLPLLASPPTCVQLLAIAFDRACHRLTVATGSEVPPANDPEPYFGEIALERLKDRATLAKHVRHIEQVLAGLGEAVDVILLGFADKPTLIAAILALLVPAREDVAKHWTAFREAMTIPPEIIDSCNLECVVQSLKEGLNILTVLATVLEDYREQLEALDPVANQQ